MRGGDSSNSLRDGFEADFAGSGVHNAVDSKLRFDKLLGYAFTICFFIELNSICGYSGCLAEVADDLLNDSLWIIGLAHGQGNNFGARIWVLANRNGQVRPKIFLLAEPNRDQKKQQETYTEFAHAPNIPVKPELSLEFDVKSVESPIRIGYTSRLIPGKQDYLVGG
jgi:hypothetical protein